MLTKSKVRMEFEVFQTLGRYVAKVSIRYPNGMLTDIAGDGDTVEQAIMDFLENLNSRLKHFLERNAGHFHFVFYQIFKTIEGDEE